MGELFRIDRIMGFCEKVCYFFIINLLFIVSNIPALLFLLFVGAGQIRDCLPLFLLCLLPMAPALSAVMYAMNRIIRGTEGKAIRDYRKGFFSGFWQKIRLGCGQLFVIFMCQANMEFFSVRMKSLWMAVVFAVLFAMAILITPTLYMLVSRYEMTDIQLIKAAVTLMIAKPVFTLGNIAALCLILAAFEISAGTTVLFMGSVYGFLVMFMNQSLLRKLEK